MKYSFPALKMVSSAPPQPAPPCAWPTAPTTPTRSSASCASTPKNVQLLCLPEFALTGYTCSDLFLQDTLLRGAEDGLAAILKASED